MNAQVQVLQDAEFLQRKTSLWYYILAEAASLEGEQRFGPGAPRSSLRCWSGWSGAARTPSWPQKAGSPPLPTVHNDNIPKVRFSATLNEEPEVEVALI